VDTTRGRAWDMPQKTARGWPPCWGWAFQRRWQSPSVFFAWGQVGMENSTTHSSPLYQISGNLTWVHGRLISSSVTVRTPWHRSDVSHAWRIHFHERHYSSSGASWNDRVFAGRRTPGPASQTNIFPLFIALTDRVSVWAGFAQDKWKLRNDVTLTFGLRFDHRGAFSPRAGLFDAGPVPQRRLLDWAKPNAGALQRRRQGSLPACSAVADPFRGPHQAVAVRDSFWPKPEWMSGPR